MQTPLRTTNTVAFDSEPILSLQGIHKWFGGVHALDNVSLGLHTGEIIALVGDNGAGKSTLVKVITGVNHPDEGVIHLDGKAVTFNTPLGAREAGIETVYQDLALVDTFDLVENFFLGREATYRRWLPVMRRRSMKSQARKAIAELKVTIPGASMKVAQMSGGQRQGVAVARAVFWNARVLLLDEPTAALGIRESGEVSRLLRDLADKGTAMIIVSHKLDEVFKLADTICVLRQGRQVATAARASTNPDEVVRWITGAESVGYI